MANSENLDLKRLDEPKASTNFNHQIYYQNNFDKIDAAMGAPPSTLTTEAKTLVPAINELKSNKVDKVAGKGLSTNDFSNEYKAKIDVDIPAQLNDIEQDFSAQLAEKALKTEVGLLSGLLTATKTSIVNAINELFNNKANKAQENWITPTLLNGWSGTVKYRKTTTNRLEFKGSATGGISGQVVFSLISGYRPLSSTDLMMRIGYTSNTVGFLFVNNAGSVIITASNTSLNYIFDGLSIPLD
jgi:hypothetical protein